ncbi:5231_t:CDS:2 [Diversispora eburnea]|uniref:5231_t:CDS:1 n=1 Tax=Diversispora eburnea TaxID=1213867 RepID=A0A9N9ASS7_9GLOM|nr:5231_t:CDS:2 [Diversispora eburnea]
MEDNSEYESVFSEPPENTLISNIELNEGNTYSSEKAFITAVKSYAKQKGFQVRLARTEKNAAGQIQLELNESTNYINENEDYEYLLNRVWYKVQQIVKAKPKTAKKFYNILDESVKKEFSIQIPGKEFQSQNNNIIKNSAIIKGKTNKPSKRQALNVHQQNIVQNKENRFQENATPSSSDNKCPFCVELLPNPLPSEIRLLLNKIHHQDGKPTQEDRQLFCKIHNTKTIEESNLCI